MRQDLRLPNRAPIHDPSPGKCCICNQSTSKPYSRYLYSAEYTLPVLERLTSMINETYRYSRFEEHPLRICARCEKSNRVFKLKLEVASVTALIFGMLILLVYMQRTALVTAMGSGLIGGLFQFVVAWTLFDNSHSLNIKTQNKILEYRHQKERDSGKMYHVFTEDRFLELTRGKKNWWLAFSRKLVRPNMG